VTADASPLQLDIPLAWHRLSLPAQPGTATADHRSLAESLPAGWKLLLFSDGSVTRHLEVLTGESVQIELIEMSRIGCQEDGAPPVIDQIHAPRLRRQVWLHTASGQRLAYAVSWWEAAQVDEYLENRDLPIWTSLASQKTELYREIHELVFGNSDELERAFGCPGPFWGRYYFFWHNQRPLTLIYEVFSPALQTFL